MKRTTKAKIKLTEGRKNLISHVETYHRHLKGKLNEWSNERLLQMANPADRDELRYYL